MNDNSRVRRRTLADSRIYPLAGVLGRKQGSTCLTRYCIEEAAPGHSCGLHRRYKRPKDESDGVHSLVRA